MNNIIAIFPIAVGIYTINREFTETELNFCRTQQVRKNSYNLSSVNNYILNSKEMSDISIFVKNCLMNYYNTIYTPANDTKLRITQSWFNYAGTKQSHHLHHHPNSFISGVMYLQNNDPEGGKIYFDRGNYSQIEVQPKEYNDFTMSSYFIKAEPGKLILFPSTLAHSVEEQLHATSRISMSFNSFPVGLLGSNDTLTELVV